MCPEAGKKSRFSIVYYAFRFYFNFPWSNAKNMVYLGLARKKGVRFMVEITELAAQKVKEVLKSQNKENAFLRLYLAGVG
ncbi:hypothetical protein DEAC_c03470 [Desulfosporosinus acididurans]|uniref:Uncharacterized protein n=1 Tax=Desulfosporosinus acididurans TaxID=476652 RepID=A0A0J1FX27_9FIRM|nr:hypothetical protein DEAC_c03470 [Desulfosporosinus acididurans]